MIYGMAGNRSAWRNRPVDLTKNTQSDGRDLSSGRKKDDEEKKKKGKATVTYDRPDPTQDPAERPEGTATVTGVNSRAEAVEAYRADRAKTQEKARREYKNAIRQYQLKTGKTVDSPNAVTAADRLWNRGSNPTDTTLSDTTRRIVEARRNTKQKKQELEDYDNQEYDWTDANARKAHEEGRKEKEAAVSQAEQEQNQATAESDRAIIGGLSDEGREKLTEYAKQKDRATGPRRESGSEIEQWFAENQHMNADELGNLAETVIRDKNAAHMEQEQQWARDAADAHPFAASAVTVPANLVSGVASTVGNLGQAIDQKLNGEGHYTGLDPYNEANLLQSMSGAARGEVKGNIVGDGSNPLRTIAGGAYDLGMGILDTKARLALGTLTGGGSLVGMGIAGANQFGNAVQDAASRGASTEQALGYAAATSVVDALTEKIPLDNLLNISSAKGGTGRIMQMLSGILGEGAQETASQLASVFTDAGIMREKSERNLEVAQMMVQNPGMSLEEAQAIVDKGILWDMIYNVAIASAGGGFNALLATFERDWKNKKGRNAVAQNPQEQPVQEAAEAPDSEKATPLDGEQMARALADQAQPARAKDLLADSEAEFDQAFDRVMNQDSQTPESQTEAPKTDTDAEMDRRAKMALGMEDGQNAENAKSAKGSGQMDMEEYAKILPEEKSAKGSGSEAGGDSGQAQSLADKMESRDYNEVGNRKVKAFMDENPEVKPYYRAEAQNILMELRDTTKGERFYNDDVYYASGGEKGITGVSRHTSDTIAQLLDQEGFTYDQLEKGLQAIIDDHGRENNAASKRLEFTIYDRLMNGYQDFYSNDRVPASEDFRNIVEGTPGTDSQAAPAQGAKATADNPSPVPETVQQSQPAAQPEARQEQPAAQSAQQQPQAQNAQQQPQAQNAQPVQQQPQAQQATPQSTPQEAQGGAQRLETNGQAQTPDSYVPGAQASAEGDNVQRSRPGDVRPMEVPKTDQEGKRVTEFAGNAYGAQATPDSMAEEIKTLSNDGSLSFDTRTNRQSLEQAADYIGKRGADTVRGEITARAASGKMDDGDIEKAMLLYTRYANDDSPKSQEAASEMMVALSSMANKTGRNLQMFGMMRKMTPEGQLMTVEKTVEQNVKRLQQRGKVKKDYVSDGVDAELEADYLKAAKKAKKATDPEAQKAAAKEMRAAEDAIYKAEAAKMPATFAAKWNAWRYMSMMGNVRTNVRNIEGNAAFVPYKIAKDKLGALAEKVLLPKDQRTKSLVQDADLLAWAKEDTKTDLVQDALQYTGLLGDDASTQKLEEGKRVFKNNALEGYRKLAEELPAKGDALFKNSYYARSLAGFLKARGISVDDITSGNVDQKILTEARNYSINEAMKATFNDANALSDFVSNMGRSTDSNPVAKVANAMMEGVLPFRRTPANIIVRFKDYSPIGLLQGVYDAARNVKAGKVTAAGAIDEICAGVTGTGAMMLGYAMAKGMGGVKLTGSDVDEDEKRQGHQQYALEFSIGGQEYSYKIDWAAPANLPLFVGANVAKMLEDGGNDADVSTFSKFLTAGKGMFEPMLELSMLSSLNELLSSGKYTGESGLYQTATGMITSYLTQAVPTILRQADTASQKYAQTTYANSADPNIRELQRTAANLPFVGRAFKTDKVDAWGEKVDNGSAAVRAFNAFVNPGTLKKIQESPLEQEITRLNGTQESNVSPDSVPKVVSYTDTDGEYIEDLRLTDDQYEKWATTQGQTARRIQDDLVKNPDYQNLSDKQKAEALNLAKEYAKEQGKRAALAGYPETGESWMVGIDGKEAAAIVDKVNAGTLQNAIAGLSEAMKNDWNTGNREKTLEEGYSAYEKMDAQTKARVAESVSGDTARYLEAREAGVSTTAYLKVLDAVKHADGTGNSAKYRAITSASISDSAMDKLMKAYMPDYDPDKPKPDKTELKYDYARKELGMTPAEYAQAYEIYTSKSDDLHYKKQKMAKWTELYGADMARQLWKLYGGKLDVVDWWEDQQ